MNHYTHLTINEREMSRGLIEQGFSFRAIARKLKRAPSTISREFKRNQYADRSYVAFHAEKKYRKRKQNCGRKPILLDKPIFDYVYERILLCWTPEQIAERAKLENQPFAISFVTIYRAVDKGLFPKGTKKQMRFKWKHRKCKGNDTRGFIPDILSIHTRSSQANDRVEPGHWESDTVLGKRKTGCIGTHVARKTGYLVAFRLDDRKDDVFTKETIKVFNCLPLKAKKSFTVDRGKEFASHKELSEKTKMNVYFCDPYSPWQRGTNENTNGLLRQFFPKGSSFLDFSDRNLQFVVEIINNRPRKRLGFRTPSELFSELCCT